MVSSTARRFIVGIVSLCSTWMAAASAGARPEGEPQFCSNCHYKKEGPIIQPTFSPDNPKPGDTVTITVSIKAVNPEAKRTGLMILSDQSGTLSLVDPQTTRLHDATTMLHSVPRVLMGGMAQFQARWKAPAVKGVATFAFWSITGNSNGTEADDHHSTTNASIAFGCDAKTYYPDGDGDGYGDTSKGQLSCDPIPAFIVRGGDCKDDNPMVNPGAVEKCNVADDNCDGKIDEGLNPGIHYEDADGDGYAPAGSKAVFTCSGEPGFADKLGDCAPDKPNIHPGAKEIANGTDDNCNGLIDEMDTQGSADGGLPQQGANPDAGPGGRRTDDERIVGGCTVGSSSPLGSEAGFPLLMILAGAALSFARFRRRN